MHLSSSTQNIIVSRFRLQVRGSWFIEEDCCERHSLSLYAHVVRAMWAHVMTVCMYFEDERGLKCGSLLTLEQRMCTHSKSLFVYSWVRVTSKIVHACTLEDGFSFLAVRYHSRRCAVCCTQHHLKIRHFQIHVLRSAHAVGLSSNDVNRVL